MVGAVVDWALDRPPILDIDFPNDRANGERARDVWYECRRRPNDEPLPVVDPLASEVMQKQQRHERSLLWKKALRRYNNTRRDPEAEAHSGSGASVSSPICALGSVMLRLRRAWMPRWSAASDAGSRPESVHCNCTALFIPPVLYVRS